MTDERIAVMEALEALCRAHGGYVSIWFYPGPDGDTLYVAGYTRERFRQKSKQYTSMLKAGQDLLTKMRTYKPKKSAA